MTGHQDHIIGARTLHLGLERVEVAAGLSERASALWRTQLAPDAEALFSARCSPLERVRLDRVELTLGTISEEAFETEFPARFRAALDEELRRQLSQLRAGDANIGATAPTERSALELLEHVLLQGTLPWWGPAESAYDPPHELAAELRRAPVRLASLARKIGRHVRVRSRVIHWLADPEIAELVRALAGGDAAFILRYAEDLAARQEEERIVAATTEEFRHAKWEVILAHLLADRGSRFNTKSFLRQTLQALAGRFRLEYAQLLGEFARAAVRSGLAWREATLPQLLEEIFVEDVLERDTPQTEAAWRLAWQVALRSPPAQWSASRRTKLAFWRELPGASTRRIAAAIVADGGTARWHDGLAALCSPDELRGVLAIAASADAIELDVAAPWTARWDDALTESPDRLSPQARSALAYWRVLPPAEAQAVTEQLVHRHGHRALAPWLALAYPGEERPTLPPEAETLADDLALPALRTLLQTGSLPLATWALRWHRRREAWLRLMLVRHAGTLPALLRAWAKTGPLTSSIPEYFPDDAIESIVETVEPAHAAEIGEFVRPVNRSLSAMPGVAVGSEAFRRGTWTVVLDYLLSDRGSVFNTRSFLEHSIDALAVRHRLDANEVLTYLASGPEAGARPHLLRDLQAIAERRRQRAPADSPHLASLPAGTRLSEDALRRSPLLRLQLLSRVLDGQVSHSDAVWGGLLPQLWTFFSDADRHEAWPELVRHAAASAAAIETIVQTGGERMLFTAMFEGQPAQAEIWQEALSWFETSAAAAALFPGARAGLRGRLWQAALAVWREGGGRPIRNVGELLVQVMTRLQRGTGARSGDSGDESILDAALARDGSQAASRIAARVRAHRKVKPAAVARPATLMPEPDEPDGSVIAVNEPIAVSNAGLVLLAPFLPELHKRCGLLEGGMFRDFAANQRAIHLLQFAVNGGLRTHEYSLVLNKLLCGIPPESAVVPHVELDDTVKATATGMLENVAKLWPHGAVISVDGIRTSYLHRPGRLTRLEKGWSLKVETRGWDVLLADLPWSFGRVHPAWMPEPLIIDWI